MEKTDLSSDDSQCHKAESTEKIESPKSMSQLTKEEMVQRIRELELVNSELSQAKEELTKYIYKYFKQEAHQKGLQLVCKRPSPAKEIVIKTDKEKISFILTNLIQNAIKYTDKGIIEFGYQVGSPDSANELEFFVIDTGTGISKEKQKTIFDQFNHADFVDGSIIPGMTLGLTVSKAYIELLGGQIRVESTEGIGSAFYFTIPFREELSKQKLNEKITLIHRDSQRRKNLKILIAEDDEISAILLTRSLRTVSREIIKARTGIEAVEACRNNPDIDLILMDIRMPEMNGHDATRQIRKFNSEVIIIAQTAFAIREEQESALLSGCDDYMTKPIDPDLLLRIIDRCVEQSADRKH